MRMSATLIANAGQSPREWLLDVQHVVEEHGDDRERGDADRPGRTGRASSSPAHVAKKVGGNWLCLPLHEQRRKRLHDRALPE